jgi:hypothetical protein
MSAVLANPSLGVNPLKRGVYQRYVWIACIKHAPTHLAKGTNIADQTLRQQPRRFREGWPKAGEG